LGAVAAGRRGNVERVGGIEARILGDADVEGDVTVLAPAAVFAA
jgi:hypothetical protein